MHKIKQNLSCFVKKGSKSGSSFGPTLWVGGRGRSKSVQNREKAEIGVFQCFDRFFTFWSKKVKKWSRGPRPLFEPSELLVQPVRNPESGLGPVLALFATFCEKGVKNTKKQVFALFMVFRVFDQNVTKTDVFDQKWKFR